MPKTNQAYWTRKIKSNMERDAKVQEKLKEMDWNVLVIWECRLKDLDALTNVITEFLEG